MLTFDHVPPQAALAPTAVMVQHIAFRLGVDSRSAVASGRTAWHFDRSVIAATMPF